MLRTLSTLIRFCFILTLFSAVLAAPHAYQHARMYTGESWLRAKRAEVAAASHTLACPNLPAPLDKFIDFSAKIRGQPDAEDCSTSGLLKRQSSTGDYSCD